MSKVIKTLKTVKVYENDFITVYDNQVLFPSGIVGTYIRTRWKAPHGVAVLPVIDNKALLIETYRYAELSVSLEVPQGFGTDGSTPKEDAEREILEEIGASNLELLPMGHTGKDFKTHLFWTTLNKNFNASFDSAEATESISGIRLFSKETLREKSFSDLNIFDPVTQICLLKFIQS